MFLRARCVANRGLAFSNLQGESRAREGRREGVRGGRVEEREEAARVGSTWATFM